MYSDIDRYGTYSLYEMELPEARTVIAALQMALQTWKTDLAIADSNRGSIPLTQLSNEDIQEHVLLQVNISNCEKTLASLAKLKI